MTMRPDALRLVRDTQHEGDVPVDPSRQAVDGLAFFSDAQIVARYRTLRSGLEHDPAETIEQPIVRSFLGDVGGRAVLDLGCGEAFLGRQLLAAGAAHYLGIDGSPLMVAKARQTLAGTGGIVEQHDLERWCGGLIGRFDMVVSCLTFQYVADLPRLFEIIRHHLKPGGVLVFSVEHPVMTSSYHALAPADGRSGWAVYDYFRHGSRDDHWLDAVVRKHHRTIAQLIDIVRGHGFDLDRLSEGEPDRANFETVQGYEARLDVPICCVLRCIRRA
ncbi:MAG: methyltransferase domain-containing protein [Phyllobacteriaceae bacterium]|nr:methyltransferase domain-containing protein [Phyllobacteriaceae bacterium]